MSYVKEDWYRTPSLWNPLFRWLHDTTVALPYVSWLLSLLHRIVSLYTTFQSGWPQALAPDPILSLCSPLTISSAPVAQLCSRYPWTPKPIALTQIPLLGPCPPKLPPCLFLFALSFAEAGPCSNWFCSWMFSPPASGFRVGKSPDAMKLSHIS